MADKNSNDSDISYSVTLPSAESAWSVSPDMVGAADETMAADLEWQQLVETALAIEERLNEALATLTDQPEDAWDFANFQAAFGRHAEIVRLVRDRFEAVPD